MLMIHYRFPLLVMIVAVLAVNVSASYAQTTPHLQLVMIGHASGPYYAPAGQTTQLKMEILNLGRDDVYLIRSEVYLDPNLDGKWELVNSESMGNFHLNYLQSAIWTFDLAMPSSIRAPNATNSVPQVVLLTKTIYSTASGVQQTEQTHFALSVHGAIVGAPNNLIWIIPAAVVSVLVLGVLGHRHMSKRKVSR